MRCEGAIVVAINDFLVMYNSVHMLIPHRLTVVYSRSKFFVISLIILGPNFRPTTPSLIPGITLFLGQRENSQQN